MADAIEAGKQQVKAEEFESAPAEETMAPEAEAVEVPEAVAVGAPEAAAVEAPGAAAVEKEPALEQLSQGESAEETVAAELSQEEVPAE